MFTDQLVTPVRLEVLIGLLRSDRERRWSRDAVLHLLQPDGLPDLNPKRNQAVRTILAAKELELIEETEARNLVLKVARDDPRDTSVLVRDALDRVVLSGLTVEPYFAPFYGFVLGQGMAGARKRSHDDWATEFRAAYPAAAGADPFNKEKLTGLHRWYSYTGLGWYDVAGAFQCNPYGRLRRRLPALFGSDRLLSVGQLMTRLAEYCPELDGGEFFRKVQRYDPAARRCTLGLSHALIDLHLDGVLRLHCPADSEGWHVGDAVPPRDPDYIRSERVDRVEWINPSEA